MGGKKNWGENFFFRLFHNFIFFFSSSSYLFFCIKTSLCVDLVAKMTIKSGQKYTLSRKIRKTVKLTDFKDMLTKKRGKKNRYKIGVDGTFYLHRGMCLKQNAHEVDRQRGTKHLKTLFLNSDLLNKLLNAEPVVIYDGNRLKEKIVKKKKKKMKKKEKKDIHFATLEFW